MGSLIPWIEITIPGFVYVLTLFVLFLCLQGKNNLDFPASIGVYIPYIAVGAVFLSYVVGFSAHLLMERAIAILLPSTVATPGQLLALRTSLSEPDQYVFGHAYVNLVMFRHLVAAFLFLTVSLFIWLRKSSLPKPHFPTYIVCLFFIAIFSYAYCLQRDMYVGFQKQLKIDHPALQIAGVRDTGGLAMEQQTISNIISSLSVIVAAVYAYLTNRIVNASKRQTDAILRPYITVRPRLSVQASLELHIKNTGKTNAENLKLRIDRDVFQGGSKRDEDNLAKLYAFRNVIASFPPESELTFPLGTSIVLQDEESRKSMAATSFTVEASYSYSDTKVTEKTLIDLQQYIGVWMPPPTVEDRLAEIRHQVTKLTESVQKHP